MITQIYEIQTPFEAEGCIEAGVDHIGSVILSGDEWKQSVIKDTVGVSNGSEIKNSIIPLFRNMDTIFRLIDYYRPDIIHFCDSLIDDDGNSTDLEGFIQLQTELRLRFPEVKIMRSVPIPRNSLISEFPTFQIAERFEDVSDLFLTDTWLGKEPVEGFIGITGKRCDPEIANKLIFQSKIPVILAGGLSPDNVYEAIMETHPAGADSCTLTNAVDKDSNPIRFKKDFNKIKRFVDEVRRADKDVT